jgi:integrase
VRTILINIRGKGGRIRSVAVPPWAAQIITAYADDIGPGRVLRSISPAGALSQSLSAASIHSIIKRYGAMIGVPDLAPHDLRRTYSRLARLGGAPLETIQHSLGHASVQTTERYVRTGEEANAGDFIKL